MSTHNICFCGEIRKNQYLWIKKSALTSVMCKDMLWLTEALLMSTTTYVFVEK